MSHLNIYVTHVELNDDKKTYFQSEISQIEWVWTYFVYQILSRSTEIGCAIFTLLSMKRQILCDCNTIICSCYIRFNKFWLKKLLIVVLDSSYHKKTIVLHKNTILFVYSKMIQLNWYARLWSCNSEIVFPGCLAIICFTALITLYQIRSIATWNNLKYLLHFSIYHLHSHLLMANSLQPFLNCVVKLNVSE